MITIHVNGKPQQAQPNWSIDQLIHEMGLSKKRIAIEMNGEIIPKSQHKSTHLTPEATLEIVVAVGGG